MEVMYGIPPTNAKLGETVTVEVQYRPDHVPFEVLEFMTDDECDRAFKVDGINDLDPRKLVVTFTRVVLGTEPFYAVVRGRKKQ